MRIWLPALYALLLVGCRSNNSIDGDWTVAMPGGGIGTISLGKGIYNEKVPALLSNGYTVLITGNYDFDGATLELIPANYKIEGPDKGMAEQILQGFDASQSTPIIYKLEWSGGDLVYLSTGKGESNSVMALSRNGVKPDLHRLTMSFSGSVSGSELHSVQGGKWTVTPGATSTTTTTGGAVQDPHGPPPIPEFHRSQLDTSSTSSSGTGDATATTGSTAGQGTTTGMLPPSSAPATTTAGNAGGPPPIQPPPSTGGDPIVRPP